MNTAVPLPDDFKPGKLDAKTRAIITNGRRDQVAHFLMRGFAVREIQEGLAKARILNPQTKLPWDLRTIHSDVAWLKKSWEREYVDKITVWKSRLLAECQELKKQGWSEKNYELTRKAIETQAKILGIYEVDPTEQPVHSGQIVRLPTVAKSPEEWLTLYGQPGASLPPEPPELEPQTMPLDITPHPLPVHRPAPPWAGMSKLTKR